MKKTNTIHVEASIIGTLICAPEYFATANKVLKPEMFQHYRAFYDWMYDLDVNKMMSWDIQMVSSKFGDISDLIVASEPETCSAQITYLKEEFDRVQDGYKYINAAAMLEVDSPYNVREYIIAQIGESGEIEAEKSRGEKMHEAWKEMESGESGADTIWADFNRLTGGIRRGQTGFLAGTTGTGKTEKALALGLGLAKEGKPFAFFSIELTELEVWQRVYAKESGLSIEILSRRRYDQVKKKYVLDLTADESKALSDAMTRIANAPFYVIDARESTNKATILRQKIRWYIRKYDLFAYCIDFVQLCETGIDKIDNSGNDTKGLSKFAKDMSNFNKVTNVAGIWLSQLNRGVMSRADRRPWNSDLMATSALENAADWIILLFRPGAYEDWSERHNENGREVTKYNYKGTSYNLYDCEYILSKNRRFGGKTGSWWEWQELVQPASNQFPVKEQPHAAPLQEPAQADNRNFDRELEF